MVDSAHSHKNGSQKSIRRSTNGYKKLSSRSFLSDEEKRADKQIQDFLAMKRISISPSECGQFGSPDGDKRIVGGRNALPGEFPWIVSIAENDESFCGGTIINKDWILTAAHCFMTDITHNITVRIGSDYSNNGTRHEIAKIIRHHDYNDDTFYGDIALIKTKIPMKFRERVQPICLPLITFIEPLTNRLTVAGWGDTVYQDTKSHLRLRSVALALIRPEECIRRFSDVEGITIFKSQICTWSPAKDACQGDSGGPLMEIISEKTYLIGIVSSGMKCADRYPGLFTKVSFYLSWIRKTIIEN